MATSPKSSEASFVPAVEPKDLQVDSGSPHPVVLESHNVPLEWFVNVRVTMRSGDEYVVNATHTSGDVSLFGVRTAEKHPPRGGDAFERLESRWRPRSDPGEVLKRESQSCERSVGDLY